MNKKAILEGVLFIVGDEGVTVDEIKNILEVDNEEIKQIFMELKKDYEKPDRGLRISYLGNRFKLTTKEEHREYYEKLVTDTKSSGLSNAALEVLAVIAYNEPITRLKIDEIRGVELRVVDSLDLIGKEEMITYHVEEALLEYVDMKE